MGYGIWDMGHGPGGASEKVEGRKAGYVRATWGRGPTHSFGRVSFTESLNSLLKCFMYLVMHSAFWQGCGGGRWNEDARMGKEEAEEGSAGGNRQQ
eukprot:8365997-Pyramimonas_sp.AAC.1